MIRSVVLPLLLALSACASATVGVAAPPTMTGDQLRERVASFAQPTHDGRLAVLKAQLDAAGLTYTVEEFPGRRKPPFVGHNVIVRTGPTTGKQIVLSAHYDALEMQNGKLVDGAIDNAASVVAMIEATKRVAGRTKHPVTLFLTDQEELGLLGAHAFVKEHGIADIATVINADVNGNGDTLMYGLNNGAQSAFMIDAVKSLCAERSLSCLDFPQYPPSDDRAFSAAGAPTISLGHQPKAEAEKMRTFLLNPPTSAPKPDAIPEVLSLIHTPNDTIARVEASTLALAADTFTALVMKLDAQLD